MNDKNKLTTSPKLPLLLATPFRFLPERLHSQIVVIFLNRLLSQQLTEGELDFLADKVLKIKITDISIGLNMSLAGTRLVTIENNKPADLLIQASLYDFLLLAARQEDSDTLVFQRRLVMQGDTELGLELKNLLDSLDIESNRNFKTVELLLQKSLPVYQRLFSSK